MSTEELLSSRSDYKYGFSTDIETESIPKGLTEETIHLISKKKNEPEFLLNFRLKAYRKWLSMKEPDWANLQISPIDFQDICYYSEAKVRELRSG